MTALPRRVAGAVRHAPAMQRRASARVRPVERETVLYESFFGRGVTCQPEAIFRAALAAPDLAHLHHVWVLDDPERHPEVVTELGDHPRVRFVRRLSTAYDQALATAGYLVNNSTFPGSFNKRPEQVYVNTWHGTPIKVMGYDEPDPEAATRNVVRNFLMADYLLSSGPWMTRQMYETAYRLVNIAPGLVVEEGQPRTDRQFLDRDGRRRVREHLAGLGLLVGDGQCVVLVAPTWHGAAFASPSDDLAELERDVTALAEALGDRHTVLVRVHQTLATAAAGRTGLRDRLVPDPVTTNELLGAVDLLVTDYSSILFDFLPLRRPIVLYTPHHDRYVAERGLYLGLEDLPGPVATTVQDLAAVIAAAGSGGPTDPTVTHGPALDAAVARFAPRDDGHAAERVVDVVLRGRHHGYAVSPVRRDGRRTVLVYLGGMRSNGITSAALGMLREVDRDRFDVTALYGEERSADIRGNLDAIPRDLRRITRVPGHSPSLLRWFDLRHLLLRGTAAGPRVVSAIQPVLQEEWRRCLGGAGFDHVVDFSGYSPFWTFMLAQPQTSSRSVWLHNDLSSDRMRPRGRRRPHRRALGSVFTAYESYDHLVSVSAALRDINARALAEYAPPEKFVHARNTIDAGRVREGAANPDVELPDLPDGGFRFVTVGRMSPEKNLDRLVRAFAVVHRNDPRTRLVLVGDGPLRAEVEARVAELGLRDAVHLTGLVRNPWGVMAGSDTFVLSSDYEGQPMVILEARIVGLPVVTTAFGSVGGALEDGAGLVVERSVEALARAMTAARAGEAPNPPFDADDYNRVVRQEFVTAIGAG